jgi:hypothetical protein
MTIINDAFINALLADASYVSGLLPGMTGNAFPAEMSARMTPELAKYLSDNFSVVTQIDSADGLGGSGFDATVWKRKSDGKVFVSMRGTEGLQDFLTDIDLATTGNARAQLVDMVNWWLQITTPVGQSAAQIKLESFYDNSSPPSC